jgi:hypothetical protein
MSHPIIRALGDYLQLSNAEGLLHALKLEPRRSVVSRTLSSLKLLGTGIAIGRGIDMYADTIIDYANRANKRTSPRVLSIAGALAVGVGIGVGAVLFAPEVVAGLRRGEKRQPSPPSPSPDSPVTNAAAPAEGATATTTSGEATPTNGATW